MKRKSSRVDKSGKGDRNGLEDNNVDDNEAIESETEPTIAKKKKTDKRGGKKAGKGKKAPEQNESDAEEQADDSEDASEEDLKKKKDAKKKKSIKGKSGKKSKKDEVLDEDKSEEEIEPEPKKDLTKDGDVDKEQDNEEEDDDDEEYEVEQVVDERTANGVHQYLIRWKGYGSEGDTWENESTLNCNDLIKKFKDSNPSPTKGSPKKLKTKKMKKPKIIKEPEVDWSSDDEFEVNRILEVHFKRDGKREFLVSWKGYPSSQNSWEPEENLACVELIEKFMNKVDSLGQVDLKDLRVKRSQTERFTLQMGGSSRRLSRRLGSKQRIQYHDAE